MLKSRGTSKKSAAIRRGFHENLRKPGKPATSEGVPDPITRSSHPLPGRKPAYTRAQAPLIYPD
jgi:hypothetical protein